MELLKKFAINYVYNQTQADVLNLAQEALSPKDFEKFIKRVEDISNYDDTRKMLLIANLRLEVESATSYKDSDEICDLIDELLHNKGRVTVDEIIRRINELSFVRLLHIKPDESDTKNERYRESVYKFFLYTCLLGRTDLLGNEEVRNIVIEYAKKDVAALYIKSDIHPILFRYSHMGGFTDEDYLNEDFLQALADYKSEIKRSDFQQRIDYENNKKMIVEGHLVENKKKSVSLMRRIIMITALRAAMFIGPTLGFFLTFSNMNNSLTKAEQQKYEAMLDEELERQKELGNTNVSKRKLYKDIVINDKGFDPRLEKESVGTVLLADFLATVFLFAADHALALGMLVRKFKEKYKNAQVKNADLLKTIDEILIDIQRMQEQKLAVETMDRIEASSYVDTELENIEAGKRASF